jgi:GTP-binding protein HflX
MIERQTIARNGEAERAILVGVCTREMSFEQSKDYLHELAFLAETAGARAVRSFIQNLDKPVNSTYIGSGKLEEVKQAIEEEEASLVVILTTTSPLPKSETWTSTWRSKYSIVPP